MKTADEVKPNYAPCYTAGMYPELAKIFVDHGYALAVHGSMARDFDLIGVPWTDEAAEPEVVMQAIQARFRVLRVGEPEQKKHGRICYTVNVSFGHCYMDLSFMPKREATT